MSRFSVSIPVRFSLDMAKWIEEYSEKNEKKVSEIVREALREYRERRESETQKAEK